MHWLKEIIASRVLKDLEVGAHKPMGHLPLDAITAMGYDPQVLSKEYHQRNLATYIDEGTFCVYDRKSLQKLLDENSSILDEYKWPKTADEFVQKVADEIAPAHTPIFDLIADAFGDKGNTGRLKQHQDLHGWVRRVEEGAIDRIAPIVFGGK